MTNAARSRSIVSTSVMAFSSGVPAVISLRILNRAGSIEEHPKHILAIAKKILRAPANDYAWAARKRMLDRQLGNGGDAARIKQFQPIGGRQASLECSAKKR